MGKIYKNGIQYGSGAAGGATLEELTYEQYLANKDEYDTSDKMYWISDYPSSIGSAEIQNYTATITSSAAGIAKLDLYDDVYILSAYTDEGYGVDVYMSSAGKWEAILYNGSSVATSTTVTIRVVYILKNANAIPVYPSGDVSASQTTFDDATTQTGSNNVQGAIETINNKVDDIKENTIYSSNGGSYIDVNEYGNIQNSTVSEEVPIYNNEVTQAHDAVLERIANDLYGDGLTRTTSLHVNYISTGAKTIVTIKFKYSSAWGFLFGRTSGNNTICASIAHSAVTKLGASGTFTAESGTITMTLGTYAMCFLLHSGNIESITYS